MSGVPEAAGLRFKSGKFEGRSMNQIAHQYPEYIVWCYKSVSGKMGIPYELFKWADDRVKAKRASIEVCIRDAGAAQDFAPLDNSFYPPPPDPRRGVFVGDSGSNRLTPFQAATMKTLRAEGVAAPQTCQTYVDECGVTRVVHQEIKPLMPEPEGEPSIFDEVLEEAESTGSFLDGIL